MSEMRVLMAHTEKEDQKSIGSYEQNGGYTALKKAIPHIKPEELTQMVTESGLRGRGGAGFPTGRKWGFVPKDSLLEKYLVCNSDESEPGAFKDRLLIERDPHQLIEGMILTSYAIGANTAFIYCRGEFFEGNSILRKAVSEAKEKGYLGKNIFGTSYSLEIIPHPGAGAYIAGEETALLTSLEGFRATPRLKPPFPAVRGLFGKPTIVNNVETLCNIPHLVNRGPEWFKSIGHPPKSAGTKIFQVSGHIQKPGCYEFPLGIKLRDVLEYAGGTPEGRKFKACYPGGSSCNLLTERDLDLPMDYESLEERHSMLGTASIIVMDDSADLVKVVHRLMEFYQNESCGKCTPCREGTRWVVQILGRILKGGGTYKDLQVIEDVCDNMEENSFCPLAVGAAFSAMGTIKEFKEEFVAYIDKNPKANEPPVMKISYPYL